jgi:hypothetical protein
MDFAAQQDIRIAREKGIEKTLAKIEEDRKKQGVDGGKAQDKLQQAQTDLTKAQQMAMLATQKLASEGMLPATEAAIKMAGATTDQMVVWLAAGRRSQSQDQGGNCS